MYIKCNTMFSRYSGLFTTTFHTFNQRFGKKQIYFKKCQEENIVIISIRDLWLAMKIFSLKSSEFKMTINKRHECYHLPSEIITREFPPIWIWRI